MGDGPVRVAIYTHDTFGLGHVRRCSRIACAIVERAPGTPILLVTGSTSTEILKQLPSTADYVKIPTIVNKVDGSGLPNHLSIDRSEITNLRSEITRRAIETFSPDVLLVDNFPLGSRKELFPVLQSARAEGTRCILGLRDILDAPEKIRTDWAKQGIYDVLANLYDEIYVYGTPEALDVVEAYALPAEIAAKIRYCGYVSETEQSQGESSGIPVEGPFVLGTVGGGADGLPLLLALAEAAGLIPDRQMVLVTGPLMDAPSSAQVRALAGLHKNVRVIDYVENLPRLMAAADGVVAMAGYNTVSEILAVHANSLLVPRTWSYGEHATRATAQPEWEQFMRAKGLEELGLARFLDPNEATPAVLAERIRHMISEPIIHQADLDLDGARNVAEGILSLAHARSARSRTA